MFDQLFCFSKLSLYHAGLQQRFKVKLHKVTAHFINNLLWCRHRLSSCLMPALSEVKKKKKKNLSQSEHYLGGLSKDINHYFNRQPWSYLLHSLYAPPVGLKTRRIKKSNEHHCLQHDKRKTKLKHHYYVNIK